METLDVTLFNFYDVCATLLRRASMKALIDFTLHSNFQNLFKGSALRIMDLLTGNM
jgi:hypothetical protein